MVGGPGKVEPAKSGRWGAGEGQQDGGGEVWQGAGGLQACQP